MINWNFPSNNNGDINGISNAGIETFRGAPYNSLAREICQNSLDAKLDDKDKVSVEFSLFKYKTKELPGYSVLKDVLECCNDYWIKDNNKKGIKFFENSLKVISDAYINILRISDFNTKGLDGSQKTEHSTWNSLVKGNGVSNKEGGAGGSFGIGKSAPYACSNIRTIFYSTLDFEGNEAYQGVSKLTTCKYNGYLTTGTGYYGNTENNSPLFNQLNLDEGFVRRESGTDIYVIGFMKEDNYKIEILSSVLDGFLVAIWNGKLEVKIDEIVINKNTLHNLINKYEDTIDKNVINYYRILENSSEENIKIWDFNGLGNAKLYLMQHEGYCRKIYMSRSNGMKIFEQNRLSTYIEFAGILILEGEKLNSFFRDMETPSHDKWEPKRSDSKLAKKYKNELFKQLKTYVNELQKVSDKDELDVSGLGEYLADDILIGDRDKREGIDNKVSTINYKKIDMKINNNSKIDNSFKKNANDFMDTFGYEDENGIESGKINLGGDLNNSDGGGKEGNYTEDFNGTSKIKKEILINTSSTRIFCSNKLNNEYRLIFKTIEDIKEGYLKISLLGEQGIIECKVLNCKMNNEKLKIDNNKIYISNIVKDKKNSITIQIGYDNYCTIGVNVYGFKE